MWAEGLVTPRIVMGLMLTYKGLLWRLSIFAKEHIYKRVQHAATGSLGTGRLLVLFPNALSDSAAMMRSLCLADECQKR